MCEKNICNSNGLNADVSINCLAVYRQLVSIRYELRYMFTMHNTVDRSIITVYFTKFNNSSGRNLKLEQFLYKI